MDLAEFFGNKEQRPIKLHPPARNLSALSDGSMCGSVTNMSLWSTKAVVSGTDYAEAYIKAEEKNLFERSLAASRGQDKNVLDTVSLGTRATVNIEDVDRLAKTYEFRDSVKENLTISSVKEKIIGLVETNPVVIIQGPTGCGKTTQVPQYILENSFERKMGCNIVVTQPRRIAAMSIAKRVCEERNWKLGSLVGYRVGLASSTSEDTRLTYCTTGVLLQRLIKQRNMNDFTHIIIDEVHERDQELDFLLLVVRKLLRSNSPSVRVILMSATFNVLKFSNYFSLYVGRNLTNAPIISVEARRYFKVRDIYLSDLYEFGEMPVINESEPMVSQRTLVLCEKLISKLDKIDMSSGCDKGEDYEKPTVLVFLPGIYEIEEMYKVLIEKDDKCWEIVILHSLITNAEQQRIFYKVPKGCRRVILSTNIAESSITVPNVKYIIDFCLTKQLVTDPQTNFQSLELVWASKANCEQRAGRTGRVMDGRVYRLVPKEFYQKVLPDENAPEILRAPLTNVFLKAKLLNLEKPEALLALALDPPDLTNLFYSVQLLKEAGALLTNAKDNDPCDGELTDLGRIMGELPVDIHITKLILLGHVCSVLSESIIMGASMAVKNMFSSQFKKKMSAHNAKLYWAQNSTSDGIAFYNAYRVWRSKKANLNIKSNADEVEWARRNFLEVRVLREVDALVHDLTGRLSKLGIVEAVGDNKVIWTGERKQFILKLITAGAFYPHFYLTEPNNDEKDNARIIGGLDPTTTVYLSGWPQRQPGMLYAKRFQQLFSNFYGSKNNKIAVKFDHSSRVFIQFNKTVAQNNRGALGDKELTREISGQIPMSVFQAIKMREIGKQITIPVMEENESCQRADELNIEKSPQPVYLPKEIMSVKNSTSSMVRPVLPSLDTTHVKLRIKHVVDPGFFWACIDNDESQEHFETINNYFKSLTPDRLEKFNELPTVGSLVLSSFETPTEKTIFKRALVQSISKRGKNPYFASLFYIDSGTTKDIPVDNIWQIPSNSKIDKIPALVFQCTLANVKPTSMNNAAGDWPTESKKEFNNFVSREDKKLDAEIYSVFDGVVSVILTKTDTDGKKININQQLIEKSFAEFCEENYLSKENHKIRLVNDSLSELERFNHEEMQHSQLYLADTYVDPPSIEDCTSVVKLKGPFSPLEVKLYSLANIGMGFKINVHESSVNSVLLDATVEQDLPRLLVAANVVQSSYSNNVVLRNTTLLPSIPGLIGLIGLIFAPQIELRCNALRTRNIGALCGLGYDPVTKQSLFPEHDMYINFDVDITIDDLQNINRLRYWMSLGMYIVEKTEDQSNESAERILKIQNNVKDILMKIFDTNREPVTREDDLKHGQWCRYKSSMYSKTKESESFKKLIFKLHCALILDADDNTKEMMILHLEDLKKLTGETSATCPNKHIECKLCNVFVYGLTRLRSHLFSVEHRAKEAKFISNNYYG